jgi:predicted ATPase
VISELSIRNFKRFEKATFPLRALTVLTGLNGMGKSTAIQALLLARQVAEEPDTQVAQLNGLYGLTLGEASDVLHFNAADNEIDIGVHSNGSSYRYRFDAPDDRVPHLRVLERPATSPSELTGTGPAFGYLTAERLGPRDLLSVTSVETERVDVGVQGQYTAQVLAQDETQVVRPGMLHPDTEQDRVTTLRTQVEKWASDIISPIKITANWPPGLYASVLRFQKPGLMSEEIRPANVGFGFSYALPVIVAGLRAPEDGLLLVENPEAHLHPGGQSRLGRFLARAAGSGVQVVLETHSDHVLNGIRLAMAEERTVSADEVVVHFFGGDEDEPITIDLNHRGRLTQWPEGFFDQIETDLGRLSRARRGR